MTDTDKNRFVTGLQARAYRTDPVRCRLKRRGFLSSHMGLIISGVIIVIVAAVAVADAVQKHK